MARVNACVAVSGAQFRVSYRVGGEYCNFTPEMYDVIIASAATIGRLGRTVGTLFCETGQNQDFRNFRCFNFRSLGPAR